MISINPIKQVFLVFALVLILQLKQSDCKFSAPILDEDIGQSIFHENQLYLIYVCDDVDPKVQSIFNQYCEEEEKLCTILSPEVDRFTDFKAFIGETKDQYFAILDVQRRQKFVLPYLDGMTANDLRIFQSKFQQGLLQPFFASEKPDPKTYERCQRLVGKNLDEFLNNQAEIKVVFLYTQHSACEVCGEMLREYADLAERLYQKNIVIFGYFDIFKNDHPRITDQILPYFLIFSKDGEEPYGLEGQKFHELQETIIQIGLKNTDIDLDKFRREHTFNKGEKPDKQYEINYKIKGEKVERTNLQQL